MRWPKVAAKGRISLAEGLMAVTPVLVTSKRGAPDPKVLRQAMRRWAFNPPRRDTPMPADIEAALHWLARSSVPIAALQEASTVGRALDACGRKLNGSAAAPEYYRRRRRTFYAALKYAVREHHLSANPLDGIERPGMEGSRSFQRRRSAPSRQPGPDGEADRRHRDHRPNPGTTTKGAVRVHVLRHAPSLGGCISPAGRVHAARRRMGATGVQRDQLGGGERLD